jgi:hypothetical protein
MPKLPRDIKILIKDIDKYSVLKYGQPSSGNASKLEEEIRALEGNLFEIDTLTKRFESGYIVFDIIYNTISIIRKKKEE